MTAIPQPQRAALRLLAAGWRLYHQPPRLRLFPPDQFASYVLLAGDNFQAFLENGWLSPIRQAPNETVYTLSDAGHLAAWPHRAAGRALARVGEVRLVTPYRLPKILRRRLKGLSIETPEQAHYLLLSGIAFRHLSDTTVRQLVRHFTRPPEW